MKRKQWLISMGSLALSPKLLWGNAIIELDKLRIAELGHDFKWGVANAAFQVEGAVNVDGKLPSIWDEFSHKKGNIRNKHNADLACDFYHRYGEDINITSDLGFKHFRFSIAWTRVVKSDLKTPNTDGINYYLSILRSLHGAGLKPWVTLYHWDLPLILEQKGGWSNREIISHFKRFVEICLENFGDLVDHWFVVNEPAAFVSLGYLSGYHAPGKKSPFEFLKSVHHVCLAVSVAGNLIREFNPKNKIGIAYSYSVVHGENGEDKNSVEKVDAFLNRLFIEPFMGKGYPTDSLPVLKRINNYMEEGDNEKLNFEFDFVGVQYYFRVVVEKSSWIPFLKSKEVPATKRGVLMNSMKREIYPQGMYDCLMRFKNYGFKDILVSENGVCFDDQLVDGVINDVDRIEFFRRHLDELCRAKNDNCPVSGYFVWTLTDNFEWSEGYSDRFGIVHVDFDTQMRTIKKSGYWWQSILSN
jgi:beta-glucosidase